MQTDTAEDRTTRPHRPRDHPRRVRRLGDRRRRLGVRLGPAGRRRVDRRDPPRTRAGDQLDRHRRRLRLRPLRADRRARPGRLAERPYVFTKCSLLEGPGRRSSTASSATRSSARPSPAFNGSESRRSTSTRSTGRSPRRTSRRAGRRSPSSRSRGWCATSASPTSTSSSSVGSSRSRRSRRCSRSTR